MIAAKTWREVRLMSVLYFFILEALLVAAVLYWPTLAEELEKSRGIIERLLPADFLKRIVGSWTGFRGYISTQQFFKGINIVGIACAVLIGTGTIAGERETGSLEFLLSRPISRARMLWSKYWVLSLCVAIPIFLSSLSIKLLEHTIPDEFVKEGCSVLPLLHASWHSTLFCQIFLGATICLSTFIREQVGVAFAIGAIIIIEVGLYFVQELRVSSAFMLSDHDVYAPIIAGNRYFWDVFRASEVWMVAAIVVLYIVTWLRFRRLDL